MNEKVKFTIFGVLLTILVGALGTWFGFYYGPRAPIFVLPIGVGVGSIYLRYSIMVKEWV